MSENGTHLPVLRGQSVSALPQFSDLDLFGNRKGIVDLDAEVSHGALDLGMTQQKLDGPEIPRSTVDQRRLGPAKGMRAVEGRIEADPCHPFRNQAGVLPGGQVAAAAAPARK